MLERSLRRTIFDMKYTSILLLLAAALALSCTAAVPTPTPTQTGVSSSPVPTAATTSAATTQPTSTPAPTPVGFALPSNCQYVGAPVVQSDGTTWAFDCGTAANANGRATLRPALESQGWTLCGSAGGHDFFVKSGSAIQLENPGDAPGALPHLRQAPRSSATGCP